MRFVRGVPAELNEALRRGEIDLTLVSSVELVRHRHEYRALADFSIATLGPVYSVMLFSRRPWEELGGARVAVTPASATSVELLRVLLAAEGLDDAEEGVVVDYSADPPVVSDGPYGETKELFGGFYILNVASKEEAVEWAKRLPAAGPGFKTEIRRVTTIDEFPQDNEWIRKERAWRESTGNL